MSTTETTVERVVLVRTFEATLAEGDGRTLEARIVPYNVAATVADPPTFRPYREMFIPGAFERQLRSPGRVRVWLNFEHEQGLRGIVGHGVQLNDRGDGLHGSFRMHENADGDKALQLVNDGLLTGISVEYAALRSRPVAGVVQRLRAHIDKVSLCREGAWEQAQVLAVREQPPDDDDDGSDGGELEPDEQEQQEPERTPEPKVPAAAAVPMPDGLMERMTALGVEPLRRMPVTGKPWDGSPARFSDEQYKRSTLFCRGGDAPPKQDCSLPVLEPDGTLNMNALGAAAAALAGARGGVRGASQPQKAAAARKLVRFYNAAGSEPPPSLVALARS